MVKRKHIDESEHLRTMVYQNVFAQVPGVPPRSRAQSRRREEVDVDRPRDAIADARIAEYVTTKHTGTRFQIEIDTLYEILLKRCSYCSHYHADGTVCPRW